MKIKDRGVMEAHLAVLGWVPFSWAKAAAHNQSKNNIVVWLNWEVQDDDPYGWTTRDMFPIPVDPEKDRPHWPEKDDDFWLLAKALTEDERFK